MVLGVDRVRQLATEAVAAGVSELILRLRLNGLIERRPGTNTYQLTPDGQRVAIFYTRV
ncbi:MAG: hypothetical protein H0V23_08295, partial [Nocardioidaceae bacterium]|nr:hypothetical protein [Nocardioidaceae bacterium]